jgi:predicted nuclease of predicted toxin-antitoxin system
VKLLFDGNLSPRLVDSLSDLYPDSSHVHERGLGSATDEAIWEFAKEQGLTIVSKDSDFEARSVFLGAPPNSSGFIRETARRTKLRNCFEQPS